MSLVVLAGGLACTLAGLAIFYAAQPTSFRVSRSRTIHASSAEVRAQLWDLRAFEAWDPWPRLGATTPTVTYGPIASGIGAWVERAEGSSRARTSIVRATDTTIEMQNETSGGLGSGSSQQIFELADAPGGTRVTWTFQNEMHGLARFLYPFVRIEQRLGPEMETGLGRLEAAVMGRR